MRGYHKWNMLYTNINNNLLVVHNGLANLLYIFHIYNALILLIKFVLFFDEIVLRRALLTHGMWAWASAITATANALYATLDYLLTFINKFKSQSNIFFWFFKFYEWERRRKVKIIHYNIREFLLCHLWM